MSLINKIMIYFSLSLSSFPTTAIVATIEPSIRRAQIKGYTQYHGSIEYRLYVNIKRCFNQASLLGRNFSNLLRCINLYIFKIIHKIHAQ